MMGLFTKQVPISACGMVTHNPKIIAILKLPELALRSHPPMQFLRNLKR
jgi:hypothetical protein